MAVYVYKGNESSVAYICHHGILGQKWYVRRYQPYRYGDKAGLKGKEVGLAKKVKQRDTDAVDYLRSKGKPSKYDKKSKTVNTTKERPVMTRSFKSGAYGIEDTYILKTSPRTKDVQRQIASNKIPEFSPTIDYLNDFIRENGNGGGMFVPLQDNDVDAFMAWVRHDNPTMQIRKQDVLEQDEDGNWYVLDTKYYRKSKRKSMI